MREPHSPAEWQAVVDAAEACLLLESARQYGLVTGGPGVNVGRCEDILNRGAELGIHPEAAGVDREVERMARA
jgi:hypothetical protein